MDDATNLAKLRTYWKRHQTFLSMGKLTVVVGLSTTSSVFELIRRLTESGFLERYRGPNRAHQAVLCR